MASSESNLNLLLRLEPSLSSYSRSEMPSEYHYQWAHVSDFLQRKSSLESTFVHLLQQLETLELATEYESA